MEILLVLLFAELYRAERKEYKENLHKNMQLCSYMMNCKQFTFDFSPKDAHKRNILYEDNGYYSYFEIPKSQKYLMKISYPAAAVQEDLSKIRRILMIKFLFATLLLLLIAFLFTLYSLKPIRTALRINDEFIKDILHDFNTPITSMVLNLKMFQQEKGEDPFIKRVTHSVDTMLLLQNNLKSFLHHSPSQNSEVDIAALAKKRLEFIENLYPKIRFVYEKKSDLTKWTNEELLTRILDNLLSNAAKYNRPHGSVRLTITNGSLSITDTGKGIEDTQKAMQRYYKEQERGIGLGLHIVQKLANELNIALTIHSRSGKGTEVTLDFAAIERSQA